MCGGVNHHSRVEHGCGNPLHRIGEMGTAIAVTVISGLIGLVSTVAIPILGIGNSLGVFVVSASAIMIAGGLSFGGFVVATFSACYVCSALDPYDDY